jgi:hypothetical protein
MFVAVAIVMVVQLTVVEGFLPMKTTAVQTIRLQRQPMPSFTSPSSSRHPTTTTFNHYSVQKQTIPMQNEGQWSGARIVRSWVAKLSAVVAAVLAALVTIPTKAQASAIATASKVKGWDLFGRVPHDEWMFTTWRLTDPGLLKRSIVESVVSELPDAFGNFKRQKRIHEIAAMGKGVGYFVLVGFFAAILYKGAMQASLKRMAKEDADRGFARPVSAVSKQGGRKGKDIGGMDGWIDMETSDDDDKNKDDDDDDDK